MNFIRQITRVAFPYLAKCKLVLQHYISFIISYIRYHFHSYKINLSEISNALALTFWGFGVLNPYLTTITEKGSYSVLHAIIPNETLWGFLFFLLGIIHFKLIFSENIPARRYFCFVSFGVWLFITIVLALHNIAGTGVYIYPVFVLTAALSYLVLTDIELNSRG